MPERRLVAALVLLAAAGCARRDVEAARRLTGGEPDKGRAAIRKYGCNSCHSIPGIPGPRGLVGPPLDNIASRVYIAGLLPNTPENLQQWIRHPRRFRTPNAMPEMGVTEGDARDIAAYLFTLR